MIITGELASNKIHHHISLTGVSSYRHSSHTSLENNKDSTRALIGREACLHESILRSDDGDGNGNENVKKAKGLITKTTTLHMHHAFLYISLPSLHDYDVTMPNFTFYRESTKAKTKFPLSF